MVSLGAWRRVTIELQMQELLSHPTHHGCPCICMTVFVDARVNQQLLFGLLLHALLLSSLYPCLADLYISLLYTSYFSCLSIIWFLGLANRFASLSINCYWMYFYLQSCILIVCGCNCRLLYTILSKLDVHHTFLLDTMYSNNIR